MHFSCPQTRPMRLPQQLKRALTSDVKNTVSSKRSLREQRLRIRLIHSSFKTHFPLPLKVPHKRGGNQASLKKQSKGP